MIAAYAVIIVGGLLITRRLHLLALAATFWVTLAVGVGILAGSGHCMTANWAFAPVCGFDFWRVIVTSPEVLIFLFFMITDPKTVPAGRVGRVVFGFLVGVASTLLMAPQTDEFGTKVGLLAGLVVVCAARPILDRLLPEPRSAADDLGRSPRRRGRLGGDAGPVPAALAGVGLIAGSRPRHRRRDRRRRDAGARARRAPNTAEVLDRVPHQVDPATFPAITVGQDVSDWDHAIAGPGAQEILVTLAENLELENQALLRGDASILAGGRPRRPAGGDAGAARATRGATGRPRRALPVRHGRHVASSCRSASRPASASGSTRAGR